VTALGGVGDENAAILDLPPDAGRGAPALLRVNEVAQILRIGRTKAFQLLAEGELPAIRIGRAVRIDRRQLIEWLESRTKVARHP